MTKLVAVEDSISPSIRAFRTGDSLFMRRRHDDAWFCIDAFAGPQDMAGIDVCMSFNKASQVYKDGDEIVFVFNSQCPRQEFKF